MESENQSNVTVVSSGDLPRQLRQDPITRLIAVLANIETANNCDDSRSAVRISRSDFKLIRYLADTCARQARIGGALGQLIHEKDQQLQSTRTELDGCRRTLRRLNRPMQTRDAAGVTSSAVVDPDGVTTATIKNNSSSSETLPTSVQSFSGRRPLPRSEPEADMGHSDETMQESGRWDNERDRKAIEQSNGGFNVKSEFAWDHGGSEEPELADCSAVSETGAPCHVTSAREYTGKVVQQNIRLKRTLRHLITQRYASVEEFLVGYTLSEAITR